MPHGGPSYYNAYLVGGPTPETAVGVVRRDRHVWRIFLFGVAAEDQPSDVFETRHEAGLRLVALAGES